MSVRFFCAIAAFLCVGAQGVEILPASEIKAGMKGYGLSVFKGTEPERFKFEVVDVIRNIYPAQDMVLCRLEHPVVEKAGIISGMSGSPLYVVEENGKERLLGALAYGWRFNKDPIAGITPAEQMKQAPQTAGAALTTGKEGEQALEPLAAPLVIAGASHRTYSLAGKMLRGLGFIPVRGGAEGEEGEKLGRRLKAGDSVGIRLLAGDMDWTATGTVTWVEGDTVYAYGHPFRLAGPVNLPLTAAKVHTVIPSMYSSFKLSSALETVGTLKMDYMSAIKGELGPTPQMMPLEVICNVKGGEPQKFQYKVVRWRRMMPLIAAFAVWDSLDKSLPFAEDCTAEYAITLSVKGGKTYTIRDKVLSASSSAAVFPLSAALSAAVNHEFKRTEVDAVSVETILEPGNREATIIRAEVPNQVASGEKFEVKVLVRPFGKGPDELEEIALEVEAPKVDKARRMDLVIAPASRLSPPLPSPRTAEEFLDVASHFERPDVLRAAVREDAFYGMTGEGRTLRMLPSSAASALPRMQSVFTEGHTFEMRTEYMLQGSAAVSVEVEPR